MDPGVPWIRYSPSFSKAEGKGGCVTEGDAAAIELLIDDTLSQLLSELPPATTTTTTTQPTCIDVDEDGYGANCPGGDDCNDGDASVYPGADEVCDGQDNNCDSQVDEAALCPAGEQCVDGACQVTVCPVTGSPEACLAFVESSQCQACIVATSVYPRLCITAGEFGCFDDPSNAECAVLISDIGCAGDCCGQ